MKTLLPFSLLMLVLVGCATPTGTDRHANVPVDPGFPKNYVATDRRVVTVGPSFLADGIRQFRNPHLDRCEIAEGFDFMGWDGLYIAPATSEIGSFPDAEHRRVHDLALENLVLEFRRTLANHGLFPKIVTEQEAIPANARFLKLETTVTEWQKGGGAARFWIGLYGGGQPVLRVRGKFIGDGKSQMDFGARRSGVSVQARLDGGWSHDADLQLADIRSMVLDVTDFMMAIAGKYPAKP